MADLAQLVARHQDDILARWEVTARRLDTTRGLDSSALVGLLPQFLVLLCRGGDDPQALTSGQQRLVESHVANRLRQGFLLSDIVNDFGILSRCVAHAMLSEDAGDRPAPAQMAQLLHELHFATAAATTVFNEHMLEDEQLQKRYRRLISTASSDAHGTASRARCVGGCARCWS